MEKLTGVENVLETENVWDFKSKYDFVDQWFLMGTPWPIVAITATYLLFVLKLGPDYMKHRKPFQLTTALLFYNAVQVCLSMWMMILSIKEMKKVGLVQTSCLTDTQDAKLKIATLTYYYFSCKLTELMDTVFFVLRKKNNQITFLHVYHHTMMVWNGWFFLKYEPGYWMLFLGGLNSFVHVIMYAYYGLSAFPSLAKYLWWKKYITTLQLVQFFLILLQMTVNLLVNECKPSQTTVYYLYINATFFIYLFSDFYRKTYAESKTKSENDKLIGNDVNGKSSKNILNATTSNGAKLRLSKASTMNSSSFNRFTDAVKRDEVKQLNKNRQI